MGPSVLLGLALYPTKTNKLLADSLARTLLSDDAGNDLSSGVRDFDRKLAQFTDLYQLSEAVRGDLDREKLLRKTAGYIDEIHPAAVQGDAVDENKQFNWEFAGVLAVHESSDFTELIIRGRSIRFKTRLDFTELIRMVTTDSDFDYAQLLAAMPVKLPVKDRRRIIDHMYRYGAFSSYV
jgi:hypothetical protein